MQFRFKSLALAAVGALLLATSATAEDERPATVAIDGVVPDFTITDTVGKKFQLSKRDFDKKGVEASVRKLSEAKGASKRCPMTTAFSGLSGLKEEGKHNPDLLLELMTELGAPYGRIASEENIAGIKTMADAYKWVMAVEKAPVTFMCWSPNCPTSKKLNEAIHERLATVLTRVYALGSSYRDTDEHYNKFRAAFDFRMRVFPDRDLKITDTLGGKRTPHFIVLDASNKLRFRGSLDSDPRGLLDVNERQNWLTDAITAVAAGKAVPKTETAGPG